MKHDLSTFSHLDKWLGNEKNTRNKITIVNKTTLIKTWKTSVDFIAVVGHNWPEITLFVLGIHLATNLRRSIKK